MSGISFADGVVAVDPTNNTPIGATTPSTGNFTDVVVKSIGLSATGASPADVPLARDAANTLAQRNGTNAQTFRLYNTFTDASNYERGILDWATSGNELTIGSQAAGTGTQRVVNLVGQFFNFSLSGSIRAVQTLTAFKPGSNGLIDLGEAAIGWKRFYIDYTNTATVGAVTINKAAGRVRIAAAGTSVVVTNSVVTAASKVFCTISTNDATAVLKNVVPAAGSFTITLNAAATAETTIDFFVVNAD